MKKIQLDIFNENIVEADVINMNNKKEVKTKIKYLQKKKKQTMRNKYKDQKSIEQQFAEAKLVPEKDKEHFFDLVFDFLTSTDYAGDDRVFLDDNSKEKLKNMVIIFIMMVIG